MKSWLRKFALACGTTSLWAQPAPPAKPAIALIDAGDAPQWQTWAKAIGWEVVAPPTAAGANIDMRVQALEAAVQAAIEQGSVDNARIYLAGRGDAVAAVFYTASRTPDLWAAAVALGGSPQPAIDSGRLYAGNFHNVPVLWISPGADDEKLAEKLKSAEIEIEWRQAEKVPIEAVFEWLKTHTRDPYPPAIDCETDEPSFGRCYWIAMTKFDAAARNDVLPSSRLQPTVIAALDLGGFAFQADAPGPGVLVSSLPEKYNGPLKAGDRIVALDGKQIADARQYVGMMAQIKEEKPAVAMVQRGKNRMRVETRILLPVRAAAVTARVQARYDSAASEIQIVSRTVNEMRVTIPGQWVGADLNWNGVPMGKVDMSGCRLLTITKELENAGPCQ